MGDTVGPGMPLAVSAKSGKQNVAVGGPTIGAQDATLGSGGVNLPEMADGKTTGSPVIIGGTETYPISACSMGSLQPGPSHISGGKQFTAEPPNTHAFLGSDNDVSVGKQIGEFAWSSGEPSLRVPQRAHSSSIV